MNYQNESQNTFNVSLPEVSRKITTREEAIFFCLLNSKS